MSTCTFATYRSVADCRETAWLGCLCHGHALVLECMDKLPDVEDPDAVPSREITEVEIMEAETGPESPPVFEEGKRADRCIYYSGGKFQFMKNSKYIGLYDTLGEAQNARDAYEAENPPKPRGGNMRASKNGTAPVEAAPAPPTPANGTHPSPSPGAEPAAARRRRCHAQVGRRADDGRGGGGERGRPDGMEQRRARTAVPAA